MLPRDRAFCSFYLDMPVINAAFRDRHLTYSMKVIYYIGQQKTGSTSLQHFLAQNSHRLLKSGILYPAIESRGMAMELAKAMRGHDLETAFPIIIREPHNALAQKMLAEVLPKLVVAPYYRPLPSSDVMLRNMRSQIDFLAPKTVLLVSETFCSFSTLSPESIARLHAEFEDASSAHIYLSLRRPDEYLVSWHGQRLRFDAPPPAPLRRGGLVPYFTTGRLQYDAMVDQWAQAVPNAEVTVRRFKDVIAGAGPVVDFFKSTGVPMPKKALPEAKLNTSVPHAMLEIARLAKGKLSAPDYRAVENGLIQAAAMLPKLPDNRNVEMLGEKNRARLVEYFAPICQRLDALTGGQPFFPDIEDMAQNRPILELDAVNETLAQFDRGVLRACFSGDARVFVNRLRAKGISDAA